MATIDISFKSNKAINKMVMSSRQMTGATIYLYHNESDVYPYAIDQTIGDQSAKLSVTIDQTDTYGNAITYTQVFMGNTEVTKLVIEYY